MLLILPALFLALVLTGAGQLPGMLPLLVLPLLLALTFSRHCRQTHRRALPLFWLSVAGLLACAFTLLPLPDLLLGERRAASFNRAQAVNDALADLGVDMTAGDRATVADLSLLRNCRQHILATWYGIMGTENLTSEGNSPQSASAVEPQARPVRSSLTLNRGGTIRSLLLLCGVWACFWHVGGSGPTSRDRLLLICVIGGSIVAATGIAGRLILPQGKTLLWLLPVPHGQPMGPFVNRNHFALFCAMLVPVALALSTRGLAVARGGGFSRLAVGVSRRLVCLAASIVLSFGVVVSLSRSGILVLLAGLAVFTAATLKRRFAWGCVVCLLAIGLVAGVRFCPLEEFHDRMETLQYPLETASAQTRLQVWGDALQVWRDFPLAGCGTDAFRVVYPTRKSSASRKGTIHAENEYVQILADNGILGALLMILLAACYAQAALRPPGRRSAADDNAGPREETAEFRTVAVAVLAAAGVHAFFDFGLRMPLNAMLLATILATALPVAGGTRQPETGDIHAAPPTLRSPAGIRRLALAFFVVLLPVVNLYWIAAWNLDDYRILQQCELPTLGKALSWTPTYWKSWHETGRRCLNLSAAMAARNDPRAKAFAEIGRYGIWSAAFLNSSDYRVWESAATVAYDQGDIMAADQAAQQVVRLRPYKAREMEKFLITGAKREKDGLP